MPTDRSASGSIPECHQHDHAGSIACESVAAPCVVDPGNPEGSSRCPPARKPSPFAKRQGADYSQEERSNGGKARAHNLRLKNAARDAKIVLRWKRGDRRSEIAAEPTLSIEQCRNIYLRDKDGVKLPAHPRPGNVMSPSHIPRRRDRARASRICSKRKMRRAYCEWFHAHFGRGNAKLRAELARASKASKGNTRAPAPRVMLDRAYRYIIESYRFREYQALDMSTPQACEAHERATGIDMSWRRDLIHVKPSPAVETPSMVGHRFSYAGARQRTRARDGEAAAVEVRRSRDGGKDVRYGDVWMRVDSVRGRTGVDDAAVADGMNTMMNTVGVIDPAALVTVASID